MCQGVPNKLFTAVIVDELKTLTDLGMLEGNHQFTINIMSKKVETFKA